MRCADRRNDVQLCWPRLHITQGTAMPKGAPDQQLLLAKPAVDDRDQPASGRRRGHRRSRRSSQAAHSMALRQHQWNHYLIGLAPLAFLAYLGLESYGIDYRAFYLAGKSILANLNPYINQLPGHPDFYGPVNSELGLYSGWKYPPLAAYLFAPLALLDYETSKTLFNTLTVSASIAALLIAIQRSENTLVPESILITTISFPMLATIERGQIDLLLVVIATGAIQLFCRGKALWSGAVLAVLGCVKIVPLLLALGYIGHDRPGRRALIGLVSMLALIAALTVLFCKPDWLADYLVRAGIPFDSMPPGPLARLPEGIGILQGTTVVQTSDARPLLFTHDFTNGFANPLLSRHPIGSLLVGLSGACLSLHNNRTLPQTTRLFAIMPWINLINPIAWIMGLAWYFPYFLDCYRRLSPARRFLLCLPLILPPMLNVSGYLAAAATLIVPSWCRSTIPSDTLTR